jgi:outer membrane protein assembly factor BamB/tRNA A-37 threonylcarbamoyl transferase component Bud32
MSKSVPDDSQEVETSRPERQAGTGLTRERIAELARMQASHVTRPVGGKEIPRTEGRLPEGTLLQDRYRILEVVGAGGMSTVYKAQDLRFRQVTRLCAVKEMLNLTNDPTARSRSLRNFEREASLLATLAHPAIPQVYDYFTEGDHSYLVLEFIHGKNLLAVLDETPGFLPESRVVSWALQLCEVLIYLHSHQPQPIVFRDIKPSNIMVDDKNRIRLVDFGIAKVFQGEQKGTMIGTEGYSPPEQYRGVADPRVDIYSLGATLHHLLSKQDPQLEPPFSFRERPIEKVNPSVSPELLAIVYRALEYDINQRYGSAMEMYQALANLRPGETSAPMFVTAEIVGGRAPTPLWEFACEDEVRATPTVANGIVYVGAYDNNLYALDAKSGKFIWKYPAEGGIGSSPCVSQGRVYFGSQDHALYAINAETGQLLWTCPTGGAIYSSPRAQVGYVVFGSDDHKLYVVNVISGRVVATFLAEAAIRSSPAIGEDVIYFGDEAGSVYAVRVSGQTLWRFRARRGIISSPLLTEEVLYVGSRDGYLYALDSHAGWDLWRYRTSEPIVSSPTIGMGAVFFGSADGHVYSVNATNGQLIWRYKTEGQVTSSPAFYEDTIFVGSTDRSLYAIEAKTGHLRWRFPTGGPVVSSPCISEGVVYVGSCDHRVYALPI